MHATRDDVGRRRGDRWRRVAWGAAACLLLLPLVAMQFTDDVRWSAGDFVVFGAMLLAVGVSFELVVRTTDDRMYRWAVGAALVTSFLLIWMSLGVGVIGADGDPANLLYGGVLAVWMLGSLLARFRPRGMVRALVATALAQAAVGLIAIFGGLGRPWSGPLELTLLNGLFVLLWMASACLFWCASRGRHDEPSA